MGDRRLTRNAIRCRKCDEVIESRYRHDYVSCGCGAVAVDGGLAYERRAWRGDCSPEDAWEELSEYADDC